MEFAVIQYFVALIAQHQYPVHVWLCYDLTYKKNNPKISCTTQTDKKLLLFICCLAAIYPLQGRISVSIQYFHPDPL